MPSRLAPASLALGIARAAHRCWLRQDGVLRIVRLFRARVDAALPDAYAWFNDSALALDMQTT